MSACDTCPKPGNCCKNLTLRLEGDPVTGWIDEPLMTYTAQMAAEQLPFVAVGLSGPTYSTLLGRQYRTVVFDCPVLLENGRCGDYENRPTLCRRYQPGDDGLCVLSDAYKAKEKADASH